MESCSLSEVARACVLVSGSRGRHYAKILQLDTDGFSFFLISNLQKHYVIIENTGLNFAARSNTNLVAPA